MLLPGYAAQFIYYKAPRQEGFIYFLHHARTKHDLQDGWKFQISIHPDDLERAWGLIEPRLFMPGLHIFGCKVIDLNAFQNTDYVAKGKQIIIYTFKYASGELMQAPKDLLLILLDIEKILCAAQIRTGKPSKAALPLSGSRYISMRYDLDPERRYVSVENAHEISINTPHNPFGQENPYSWFDMGRPSQRFFSSRLSLDKEEHKEVSRGLSCRH